MTARTGDRAGRRELCLAVGALFLAACVIYGPYVLNGGFTIDDWGHAATAKYFRDGILENYWGVTGNRPVLVLYVPFTFILFGPHPHVHLAWAMLLGVAMASVLYALLRRVSVPPWHAGAISLLVLIFPWSDSARLWPTASHIDFAIATGLAAAVLALRGLDERATGRIGRERLLHAFAVLLYAISVLTYEIAGVVLLLVGALYLTRAPWKIVRVRWAIDDAVIVACLAWTAIKGNRVHPSLAEMVSHARQLGTGAVTVVAHAAAPLWSPDSWIVVGLLGVLASAAVVTWRRLDADDPAAPAMRQWLLTLAAGLLVALAGWILYIPADPYYQINAPGVGNRTNVMAAVGVVIAVYSIVILFTVMLFRRRQHWRRAATIVSAVIVTCIAAGYARQIHRDELVWARGSDEAKRMLSMTETALPKPRHGSTIYTFDYPGSYAPGVVIFGFSWDLNGAIKLAYDDPTLLGYPILEGATMQCGRHRVGPEGSEWNTESAPYGQAYFVDVTRERAVAVGSLLRCRAVVAEFSPGPITLVP